VEFGCETPLLAEMPETRQHFFLFFPDALFLPVVEPLVLSDAQKCVNTFFKIFLKIPLKPRIRASAAPASLSEGRSSAVLSAFFEPRI
jgi:hypothetical protein